MPEPALPKLYPRTHVSLGWARSAQLINRFECPITPSRTNETRKAEFGRWRSVAIPDHPAYAEPPQRVEGCFVHPEKIARKSSGHGQPPGPDSVEGKE